MVGVDPGSLASTPLPHPVTFDLLSELGSQNRPYKPHDERGRERAASGPRQGRIFRASSSEKATPVKNSSFLRLRAMQLLRSRTDLDLRKFDIKQICPDTARQPQPPAQIKEQTDERISQTIFTIQSNQTKRELVPGIPVSHLDGFDAPGLE